MVLVLCLCVWLTGTIEQNGDMLWVTPLFLTVTSQNVCCEKSLLNFKSGFGMWSFRLGLHHLEWMCPFPHLVHLISSFFPSSHHRLSVTPWDTMAFKVRKKAPSCCKVKWDSSGMQFITLLIACWCLFVYLLKYHWGKCFPFPLHISRELVKSSADYITFCSIYCKYCSHFPPRFWVWWDFHPSQKTTF